MRVLAIDVFGGITRCDEVARGIVAALGEVARSGAAAVPVFVRLEGTAAAEGRAVLAEAALPTVRAAADVDELVSLACETELGLPVGRLWTGDGEAG